jgi:hypothetical protein
MGCDITDYKSMSIKDAGFDELWLQNTICESPSILNLGDLRLVSREKIVSSGGRLDILLQDIESDDMYEVEVQLGDTDPSHIIRTIEYWDLIRKKYPQRQHFAVLIAESITKRFFNVISLLSANIPIIAIQCQIIEIAEKRALVFAKILDTYEEPEEIQVDSNTVVDEKYWESRAANIINIAKKVYVATKEIYKGATLEYNKFSIVIKMNMYNMIKFHKKSGNFMFVVLKYGNYKKEIFEILENNGILPIDKYAQARFTISSDELMEKIELIKEIAKLNVNWWKTEDA